MPKQTMTQFYDGGRKTERPHAIKDDIRDWESIGWSVTSMLKFMGGLWVVFEKEQK